MLDHTSTEYTTLAVTRRFARTVTEYEHRDVTVDFQTGEVARCRVPKEWSANACATLMSKYAVRAGVPDDKGGVDGREVDAERIFDRLVAGWREAAIEHGYWKRDDPNLANFCAEIKAMLEQQVAAPNSPQWFNTGVAVQYGIEAGRDGHYFATIVDDEARVHACENSLEHPQISACFIQSVDDNLVGEGGIMDLWAREARLFKYGSGSGANYSALRGKGEPLSRGGCSSGLLSFLRVGDTSAGAIKSGGTTRRSARMVIVDVDHPDVEEFIDWKVGEDAKIRALHDAGIGDPRSFEDEATETVSGQNANNSVAVTSEFMKAVADDEDWNLVARVDGSVTKTVRARDLWRSMAEAAWACADPGLQFADTINAWHTCKNDGPIRGSNPCQPSFAPVLTPYGIRTLGEINVGDTVWSGKQWTKVKRKIATGIKPVQVYHTTAGRVICTANHRVFQEGERVAAEDAETLDTTQGPTASASSLNPQDVMDGLYFGDGSYRADAAEDHRHLLSIGADDGCYHTSEVAHLINGPRPGYQKYAWSVQTTIGALPYTYEREVPEQVYKGSTDKVRGFLRGLYSANGSIVGKGKCGRVTLKASSFEVICAVQDMLSSLGIRSYYTTNLAQKVTFANGTYLCKQSYDLNITSDSEIFAKLIGFVHPYKTERLAELVAARSVVGQAKYASRTPKTTYEIKRVEDLGEMPVFDIEVEADEHSYWSGGHLISNCSEYVFLDDTACNLASLNLAKFYAPGEPDECWFNFDAYAHAARLWTMVLDISVSMAGYPTAEIARRSMLYRTLGLGCAALGELLVVCGLGYGTPGGRAFAAELYSLLTAVAYATSVELASVLGPFPRFTVNYPNVMEVLEKHLEAADESTRGLWSKVARDAEQYGVRNAQVSLSAPCGTIGIVMDCETTGVEPYYSDTTYKTLAGGGTMRFVSKRFGNLLRAHGYNPGDYTRRVWTVEDSSVREYVWVEPPAELADVLVCAEDLTPRQHVDMMAAVQPFLSGAISKTVNMPQGSTVDDVADLYTYAWEQGLKSIAIYRDGCKPSQPLQSRKPAGVETYASREEAEQALSRTTTEEVREDLAQADHRLLLDRGERHDPPATARAVKHCVKLSGHTFYLILGEHEDGSLAEVFVTCSRTGSGMAGWVNAWAKTFSLALQHGAPLDTMVAAMRGESFEPGGYHEGRPVLSPVDCFARIIEANYLEGEAPVAAQALTSKTSQEPAASPTEKPTGNACVNCGSTSLRRSGSCFTCNRCGSTTGCS
jgi:ribonucleoside-diphosphate reductase alpha chain